jgi:dienelactone hydrolase
MRLAAVMAAALALGAAVPAAVAQEPSEKIALKRPFRGQEVAISGDLYLPPGNTRVPAMIVHHGSGGISDSRERRYARELVKMGVAALVLDSFTARKISSTVSKQDALSSNEMMGDAFAALQALAAHARIDGKRVGIVGFSKGGSVALLAAHEAKAAKVSPRGLRFALHVPFYPACVNHYYRPKITGAPIYLLLGEADTYIGVGPCREYAAILKAGGARIETVLFPGARHGFDGASSYSVATGENWSRCVFVEQPDGSWKERTSGAVTNDTRGRRIEAGYRQALARCRTLGVEGGPDAEARAKAMSLLKSYVQRHLLEKRP